MSHVAVGSIARVSDTNAKGKIVSSRRVMVWDIDGEWCDVMPYEAGTGDASEEEGACRLRVSQLAPLDPFEVQVLARMRDAEKSGQNSVAATEEELEPAKKAATTLFGLRDFHAAAELFKFMLRGLQDSEPYRIGCQVIVKLAKKAVRGTITALDDTATDATTVSITCEDSSEVEVQRKALVTSIAAAPPRREMQVRRHHLMMLLRLSCRRWW